MNDVELSKFKERIYEPYTEAWTLMKNMRDTEPKDNEFWKKYMDDCYAFRKKYDTEIGHSIYRVLLDAGSEVYRIAKMQQ